MRRAVKTRQSLPLRLLFVAGALLALSACGEDSSAAECEENTDCEDHESCELGICDDIACYSEPNPLCDNNGVWFSNECWASARGAGFELDPVCGENGLDYGNACGAIGDGTTVAYEGECRPEDQRLSDGNAP